MASSKKSAIEAAIEAEQAAAAPTHETVVQAALSMPDPPAPVLSGPGNLLAGMDGAKAMGVIVPRSAVLEEYGDVFDDIDDIQERGSRFKRMLLAQGQSKAVLIDQTAHAGQWVVENFDGKKTVTIMPFSYATQRQYWRKPENLDEDVDPRNVRDTMACVSQVRVMKRSEPELQGTGDPGGFCAKCPKSQWTPSTTGGTGRPPECTLIHILYAVSLEHECRVEIPFKKTSEKQAMEMLTTLRTRGWGQVLFQLSGEPDKNKAGQVYFKAKFQVVEPTPEMIAKGAEIARRERESMGY